MGTILCKKLKLSVELNEVRDGEELVITLADDIKLEEVQVCYPVNTTTLNRKYHRKEALVIAMRRLVSEAVDRTMISISHGASIHLSNTKGSSEPTLSTIDLGC